MALLEISDLDVFYGASQVVTEVSFTVDENEVIGLVGSNGAGKTSILDSIFNYTEWEGRIRVNGTDVDEMSGSDIANLGVSYCMEEHNLFQYMTVRENLLVGGTRNRENIEENLEEVLDLFPRLQNRSDQRAKTLSGGEQQMLAIGKALMTDPELLILDEPTLGLAPVIIEDISEVLDTLSDRVAVLLVEQNVTFSFEHADEIILLDTGEVAVRGKPSDLENDTRVQEVFFGMTAE